MQYDGDLDMDLFLVPSAPAADSSGRTGSKRVADTDAAAGLSTLKRHSLLLLAFSHGAADIMAKKVCPRSFPSNQKAVPNERYHGGSRGTRGCFLTVSDKDEVEFAAGNDSLKISRRDHLNSEHHLRGGIFEKEKEEGSQIDYHNRDVEEDDNLQLHNQFHTMMDSSADCRHQAGGDPLLLPLQHSTATKSRFMKSSAHHQYTVADDLCQDQPASRSLLSIAGLSSSMQGSDALLRGMSQDEYRKYGLGNRYNHQALPTHNVEDEDMFLPTAAHGEEEEALLDLMAVMRSGSDDLINQKTYTAAAALSYDVNVPPALPDAGEDRKDEISCPSNAPVKIMKATNAKVTLPTLLNLQAHYLCFSSRSPPQSRLLQFPLVTPVVYTSLPLTTSSTIELLCYPFCTPHCPSPLPPQHSILVTCLSSNSSTFTPSHPLLNIVLMCPHSPCFPCWLTFILARQTHRQSQGA
ncbi:hypothetical protein CEUSTIGMA_g8610.t1 [Chlamydomonas eustigma]|uniref:Uncharacterized protein n=1 Tax=Chlamydomonas eustigma TaxID=1157962 RepID=A0A250XDL7_9CHLO|nr:hypothetical protein CEUSTIGMA_g8610.t1 [Chlamydomonas eustigma]|eukprot:GAX81177.1 hypothetical protein CEUSTIGMA_g8610.t1 [Chlamydomonas eustigma]